MPFRQQMTLKTAVLFPFVIIILVTIGVIGAVQKYSYEQMVQDVSRKQLTFLSSNVDQRLHTFLDEPFRANQSMSYGIGFHQLYQPHQAQVIERFLHSGFDELYRPISQIDVMSFAGIHGEFVGFRKEDNQDFTLMLKDARTQQQLMIYHGDSVNGEVRSVINHYDPRTRPFYTPVVANPRPMWSSVYTNMDERQDITLSALTPVMQQQQFVGVMVTDVKISTFNAFLHQLKRETNADVYIFDGDQRLIAHTVPTGVVSWGTESSPKGERLTTQETPNPVLKASATHIAHSLHTEHAVPSQVFSTSVDGARYFNQVAAVRDEYGLQWYINVTISEADLLGSLPQNQRNSWLLGLLVSLFGIGIGFITFNRVTAPITSTAVAAKHLAQGDWNSAMPKPGKIYETSMMVYAFTEMANNLKASFKALREQLIYDSLTKVYSREGIIDCCSQMPVLRGSLFLIGIDKFRDINDSLGHHQADQLLVLIAQRLKTVNNEETYIARIGGDEFAIYRPHCVEEQQVKHFAQQLLQLFATPFHMPNENIAVNISIGIVHHLPSASMTVWLRNGSIALSNAKQDSTRISYYVPEMADISRKRTQMVTHIKLALENREFVPFYQPIVDLHSGEVLGAEALARWLSPEFGLVPPMDFIPIAEESGLINAIGEHMLRQACWDTVQGIEQGKWSADFQMHVNLSVNQLSHPEFLPQLRETLRDTGMQPNNLTLEITESRIVNNDPVILNTMQAIKQLGIRLAIDDFGTGYSSLAYLYKLPFDCLKIDRAFVSLLNPTHFETSIAATIITLANSFKVNIVAEGIETPEQAELLAKLHCPQGQGFLFNKPMSYHEWPTDLVNMKRISAK
ncbi:EAL domain-containing protein [Vibrio furnissii]|uniref:bifunctional diguanylate cyclase/phosphodiesterase n=1 Tax=Vibrio furnissii TaxID=29494 RepID=UPI0024BB4DF6|nr:EAL domain-containing protein [Vibrio furnissii]WHR50516.1 EAL domain-containing protein [Vibrio furnissii]